MAPLIIVCGGMNRSGSTWQSNSVRRLLTLAHIGTDVRAYWAGNLPCASLVGPAVIKAHRVAEVAHLTPDRIVTCYRDLRDVAGSLVRMGWCERAWKPIKTQLDDYVTHLSQWLAIADLSFRYEDMMLNRVDVVRRTIKVVAPGIAEDIAPTVSARLDQLRPDKDEPIGNCTTFNPVTLLHNGHFSPSSNPARHYLGHDITRRIEHRYEDWLGRMGYTMA